MGGLGLPELSVDEDLAARSEGLLGDGDVPDEGLRPCDDLVAACANGDAHEEDGDESECDAAGDGGRDMDTHLGDGAVNEGESSKDEREDAGGGENAVAGEFGFENEQGEGRDEEHHGG